MDDYHKKMLAIFLLTVSQNNLVTCKDPGQRETTCQFLKQSGGIFDQLKAFGVPDAFHLYWMARDGYKIEHTQDFMSIPVFNFLTQHYIVTATERVDLFLKQKNLLR